MKKSILCLLFVLAAASLSFAQSLQWGFTIPDESVKNQAQGVVTDQSSNTYVTGTFTGRIDFKTAVLDAKGSTDVFVAKYDKDGKCLWAFQLGSSGNDGGTSIALHPSENGIYITGYYVGTVNFDPNGSFPLTSLEVTADVFVAAYDANGKFAWARSAGGNGTDMANSICTDVNGDVYLTGFFNGATIDLDYPKRVEFPNSDQGTREIFIVKYDNKGIYRFGGKIGAAKGGNDEGKSVFVDAKGSLYVGGYFMGGGVVFDFINGKSFALSAMQQDGFIARYSAADGTIDWAGAVGGESMDEVSSLAAVSAKFGDAVYATGYFSPGNADFDMTSGQVLATAYGLKDIFLAAYGSDGKFVWGNTFGTTTDDAGQSISVSTTGNVHVTGYFSGSADFDPDPKNTAVLTSYKNIQALFMAKYTYQGDYWWAQSISGTAPSNGLGIMADGNGSIYVCGFAGGSGDLEPGKVPYSADNSGDILIAKYETRLPQTITFATLPVGKVVGDVPFSISATSSSGLAVPVGSSNTSVAQVSGSSVTIAGAGTSTLTATQNGNENYYPASPVSQTLTIGKGNQTITFGTLAAKNFGDVPFTLTGTASSGLAVTYVSSNPSVATVSGNTVTIVGAGSTVITASQAGNANYNAATSVTQTLTVNKANQTITFGTLAAKNVGDPAFTLTGTASSGLAVSYSSSNPAVATVSGNTVTIVGSGTTIINASQAGNASYNAATNVTQQLVINKGNQTITFGALAAKNYGDAPFTLSGTASSGLAVSYSSSNTSVATISGNTVTIVGAGSTVITASQAGNANYNAATDVTQTLVVNKATQTITFGALAAKNFGDVPFTLSAAASSGLAVSYSSSNTSVATISGNTVTIVGAGSTIITASQPGNATYNAATNVSQTLTVNKASQTITFSAIPSKVSGDAPFTLNASASSGLSVSYASSNPAVATVSGSTITIVGVGTSVITASQGGNASYNAAANVTQTLTVVKADQSITFAPLSAKNFGDAPFALTASASSGLAVSYSSSNTSVATVSGNTVTIVGIGSTVITASQPGNANYNAATSVTQTLNVSKAGQTITFAALPAKNYGAAPFTISATASSGLPVSFTSSDPAVATVSGNTVTIVGAGTTTITATQAGDANYSAATPVAQALTVNKLNQTITFSAIPAKTYGAAPFNVSASASSGLPVSFSSDNPSVATISGNTVTIVGVGSASILASQPGDNNFNAAPLTTQLLVVSKADQSITFGTLAPATYGDAPFTVSASASSGLGVSFTSSDPAVASVSGNTITIVAPGTAVITASQPGNPSYNAASSVVQTLVVAKANQTITFGPLPVKDYNDAPFTISATANSGLAVTFTSSDNSVATVSGNTITIVGPGNATITADQPGNNMYNAAASVSQILTVNNSNQSITFAPLAAKNFGDAPFTLSATASSGLPVGFSGNNPSVATISGNTVTIVGAGTVVITASQPGNGSFGPATPVSQTLIVSKIDQTIAFAALPVKTFGDAAFTLNASATSGLSVTYTSDNPSVATVSGNTVSIIGAGTAKITAIQAGSSNYNAAPSVSQSLTVNKADQTITFPALASVRYTGEPPFSASASSSSGLAVVYTSSDETKLSVSGSTFTILATGTVTITASQPGNANYNAAPSLQQSVSIQVPDMDIIGRETVAENTTQNYSILPVLDGYKYYWTYSDGSVVLHDSTGANTSITFKPKSTDGRIYCDVYTPAGLYFYTIDLPVKVNHRLNFVVPTPQCTELDSINPCSGVYIEYFKIGTLENVSGGCSSGGYADYTQSDYTTRLNLSDSYLPEIRLGFNGVGSATFFVGLWIDFDNNGSFDDAGEFLSSFYGAATSFPLHSVKISNNGAHEGPRRLRVRVRTSGSFTSAEGCIQQGDKGETEDYLIFLAPTTKLAASSVVTANNDGKNDYFFIKGMEVSIDNRLVIFDRFGKVYIDEENYNNTFEGKDKDGALMPKGTYYYVFTYGDVQMKGFFELLY